MKVLFIGLFVFMFAFTPAYVFNELVMPEIQSLHNTYSSADTIAQKAASGVSPQAQ